MSEAKQIKQLKETTKNLEMEMTILRAWYNQANREIERLTEENRRLKIQLEKNNKYDSFSKRSIDTAHQVIENIQAENIQLKEELKNLQNEYHKLRTEYWEISP